MRRARTACNASHPHRAKRALMRSAMVFVSCAAIIALSSCALRDGFDSAGFSAARGSLEVNDELVDGDALKALDVDSAFRLTREDSVAAVRAINALPAVASADEGSDLGAVDDAGEQDAVRRADGEWFSSQAVDEAYEAFAERGFEASYVVYDYAAKKAAGRNVDAEYFCASTIKAPFSAYIATDVVGAGLADPLDEMVETEIVEGSGTMDTDGQIIYTLGDVVDNMLVYSDNTAYRMLWRAFGGEGFESWAVEWGVDTGSWSGAEYVFYTARDLAKLWAGTFDSLLATSDGAGAFSEAGFEGESKLDIAADLACTQSSLLRKTLGSSADVLSKPGFESNSYHAGESYDMGALHDAGIVGFRQGPCLIVVMSNIDYDDEFETDNEWLVADLISALAQACEYAPARS